MLQESSGKVGRSLSDGGHGGSRALFRDNCATFLHLIWSLKPGPVKGTSSLARDALAAHVKGNQETGSFDCMRTGPQPMHADYKPEISIPAHSFVNRESRLLATKI